MEKELSKITTTSFEDINASKPRKSKYKIIGYLQTIATANRGIIPSGHQKILGPSLLNLCHSLRHATVDKRILGSLGKDRGTHSVRPRKHSFIREELHATLMTVVMLLQAAIYWSFRLQTSARIAIIVTGKKIIIELGRGTLAFSTRHFCRRNNSGSTAKRSSDDTSNSTGSWGHDRTNPLK